MTEPTPHRVPTLPSERENHMKTWDEARQAFNDMIDETTPPVELLGIEYTPSRVLLEVDPIAYRTTFSDWLDGEGIDSDELEH